jgi:RNA polymerase sigma factor (sigma-70 family)
MEPEQLDQHISQISTQWTLLFQAHQEAGDGARMAQQQMLQRYSPAIYRYLLGCVRNADVADELFQEFALRFVRGAFKGADPGRGRFRDFLKVALYHLIVDHKRRQKHQLVSLPEDAPEAAAAEESPTAADREFLAIWRAELMERTWKALAHIERQSGQPLYTVLRFRTDHPDVQAAQMAEQLARRLGQGISAGWIRKRLHYAREKFTDLLIQEVIYTLENPSTDELVEELIALGLLEYCRSALDKFGRS